MVSDSWVRLGDRLARVGSGLAGYKPSNFMSPWGVQALKKKVGSRHPPKSRSCEKCSGPMPTELGPGRRLVGGRCGSPFPFGSEFEFDWLWVGVGCATCCAFVTAVEVVLPAGLAFGVGPSPPPPTLNDPGAWRWLGDCGPSARAPLPPSSPLLEFRALRTFGIGGVGGVGGIGVGGCASGQS